MEQHKEQKNTANDLRKYEELQQKSLPLLKITVYVTNKCRRYLGLYQSPI